MDESHILDTILTNTYTRPDLVRRVALVRQFLEHSFFSLSPKTDIAQFYAHNPVDPEDLKAIAAWGPSIVSAFTRDTLYDRLRRILALAEKLPILTIYIAHAPTHEDLLELGIWFRRNLSSRVILDVRTNDKLVSGCAYIWKGVYHEFALHYFLSKKRDEIAQMIAQYTIVK
jgi:hypothetical protein